MFDFTLVTYLGLPNLDPDDELVRLALVSRGHSVQVAVWNDPRVDWSQSGICVVRSTWDYHENLDAFVKWMTRVDQVTTLVNPLEMMLWNTRKTYLRELQSKGVRIVPTVFLDAEKNRPSVHSVLQERGWSEGIVKPSVGLATFGVRKIACHSPAPDLDEAHVNALLRNGPVLVQQFMDAVHSSGEKSLSFVRGRFTHCIKKTPFQKLAIAGHAGEQLGTVTSDELSLAHQALSTLNTVPLYARVDVIRDNENQPALMELELIEPSLFLSMNPAAATDFADALCEFQEQRLVAGRYYSTQVV